MKSFRDYTINELKQTKSKSSNASYESDFKNAIIYLNKIADYGRTIGIASKQLNPIIDAVKNVHDIDDTIKSIQKGLDASTVDTDTKKW